MKVRSFHYIWPLMAMIVWCTGCADVGVRVQRDPAIRDVAIQIDVIAITEQDKNAWAGTNVSRYWAQVMDGNGDPKAKVLQFSPGESGDQNLKTSPKGISYLVIISDYPSVPAGRDLGPNDPRLCIIPVDKLKHGLLSSGIKVKIGKDGIQPIPQ